MSSSGQEQGPIIGSRMNLDFTALSTSSGYDIIKKPVSNASFHLTAMDFPP
jgi:hypothetical protein